MKLSGVMVIPPSSRAPSGPSTLATNSCLLFQVPENFDVPIIVKRQLSANLSRKPWALPLDNSANMLRINSLFSAALIAFAPEGLAVLRLARAYAMPSSQVKVGYPQPSGAAARRLQKRRTRLNTR